MDQRMQEWLDMAEVDFGVAAHLYENYFPRPLEIICYHCQQAAEKTIKAIIISQGARGGLPKLHDLSFLLNQVRDYVQIEEKYYDYADTLTPYGVVVRYPNELFLEDRHAQEALKYANQILDWGKNIIAGNNP